MAISSSTKSAKVGNNKVPKPKPEKKVRIAAPKATREIIKYGIKSAKCF